MIVLHSHTWSVLFFLWRNDAITPSDRLAVTLCLAYIFIRLYSSKRAPETLFSLKKETWTWSASVDLAIMKVTLKQMRTVALGQSYVSGVVCSGLLDLDNSIDVI